MVHLRGRPKQEKYDPCIKGDITMWKGLSLEGRLL